METKIINDEIAKCHKEELKYYSMVHHLYSDGELTSQKGGDLYGRRTEHTLHFPDSFKKEQRKDLIFPLKRIDGKGNIFGYAILKYDDAVRIRDLILKLK